MYVVLILYFVALFAIGLFAARRVRDFRDFYVGGKRLGYWVVAFSARATGESAWLLLGLTGLGALVGVSAMWVVVGEVIGVAIAWFLMARPFKRETDRYDAVTVPDYLVARFSGDGGVSHQHTVLLRGLAAGALAFFVTIYVSAQIDATGKAFESFLSWNYYVGAVVGFGFVVVYTFSGGFIAVAWSDLFQGSLMLIGLVAVPVFAALASPPDGGIWRTLGSTDAGLISMWGSGGVSVANVCILISYLTVGLGFLGSPQVFVRFMAIRGDKDLLMGRWVAVVYTLLTDAGAVLTGMFGRYLLVRPDQSATDVLGTGAEGVLPAIVEHLFPSVIVGLYIAAVLAAIMSTIDSLLVVASSAVTRDFYQQIFHKEKASAPLKSMSRWVTVGLALVALTVALVVSFVSPDRTVFWFVIFGWSGIAATFCPVIILSLFWNGYTLRGAMGSMLVGFFCVPLFKFGLPQLPAVGPYIALMGEMGPSFALALLAGLVVSRLDRSGGA